MNPQRDHSYPKEKFFLNNPREKFFLTNNPKEKLYVILLLDEQEMKRMR